MEEDLNKLNKYQLLEIGYDLIDEVLDGEKESVILNTMTLKQIEEYLTNKWQPLDEDTLETNSHIDMWIRDTTNTYQISGDMWTGIYTFERLNDLEKWQ